MGDRRMSQAELSRQTGIRAATIHEIYNEMADRVGFEHLNKICEVLNCQLHEIMVYKPDARRSTGKDLIIELHGNQKR